MKICLLSNLRNLGTLSFFLFAFKEICLYFCKLFISFMGWEMHVCFPSGSVVKNPPANAANMGLIPGSGRAPVGGNGYPLQYSCLGSPTDRGTQCATVYGLTKELNVTEHARRCMHALHILPKYLIIYNYLTYFTMLLLYSQPVKYQTNGSF